MSDSGDSGEIKLVEETEEEKVVFRSPQELLMWSLTHSSGNTQGPSEEINKMTQEEFNELYETVFPDPIKKMKEAIAILKEHPAEAEKVHMALNSILSLCDAVDPAVWIATLDGYTTLVEYLTDDNDESRMGAAWIIANALQNNVVAQDKFMEQVGVEKPLSTLLSEEYESAAKRKISMIGSILKGCKKAKAQFYQINGIQKLMSFCEKWPKWGFTKLVWIIAGILFNEDPDDVVYFKSINVAEYLSTHKKDINDDEILDEVVKMLK